MKSPLQMRREGVLWAAGLQTWRWAERRADPARTPNPVRWPLKPAQSSIPPRNGAVKARRVLLGAAARVGSARGRWRTSRQGSSGGEEASHRGWGMPLRRGARSRQSTGTYFVFQRAVLAWVVFKALSVTEPDSPDVLEGKGSGVGVPCTSSLSRF